jgi:hypothetical protein
VNLSFPTVAHTSPLAQTPAVISDCWSARVRSRSVHFCSMLRTRYLFDDSHATLQACRTLMQRSAGQCLVATPIIAWRRALAVARFRNLHVEQLPAPRQIFGATAIAEEAVVTDSLQSEGQGMQQETADELMGADCHDLRLIAVGVVLPAKLNVVVIHRDQAVVGDGDPVRIASKVVEHLLGTGEGQFGIDDPLLSAHGREISIKGLATLQMGEAVEEPQLARLKCVVEQLQESTPIKARENPRGQEESRAAVDPAPSIGREAAPRHDAIEMRMMLKILTPGMQDGEESDLGAQVLGVRADRSQGLGRRLEEQVVDQGFVLQGERCDFLGQGEDDVEIRAVQKFSLPMLDPLRPGERLALRAMPVPARVVGDSLMIAGAALLPVAAKCSGPAALNRSQHALLRARQGDAVIGAIALTVAVQDLRHLQSGPSHR